MASPRLSSHELTGIQAQGGYKARFSIGALLEKIKRGNRSITKAIKEVAPKMERQMKRMSPVDTGRLRSSINVKVIGAPSPNPRIEVTTVGYGYFQEFGTSKMSAQSFILPTMHSEKWEKQVRSIAKAIEGGRAE